MTRQLIDHIKEIINATNQQLKFLDIKEEDISAEQMYPVVMPMATTSQITELLELRSMDIDMLILEPISVIGNCDTQESFENKKRIRQDEFKDIVENIIHYLVKQKYKFPYDIASDVDFELIDDFTTYELFGVRAEFSLSSKYVKRTCCVKFDESLLT